MTADIIISVRFLTTSEGERETPVQGQFYSCPLFVGDEGFDCLLLLDGRYLDLGASHEVSVKFLYRDKALPKMNPERWCICGRGAISLKDKLSGGCRDAACHPARW